VREDVTRDGKLTTEPQQSSGGALARSNWIGHLVVATIVIAVASLLQLRGRGPAPGVAPPRPLAAPVVDLPGFRADAWFLPADDLLGFVEIPAGPFTMGGDKTTDPLAFDNERWSPTQAQGTVDVAAFFIGRHEVTVAQYQAFAAASGHKVDAEALTAPPTHPAAHVSWPDALAYCRWLEAALKASPITPATLRQRLLEGWHVTLPSEAEWEKAARGTDGRRYPWGAEARRDRANIGAQGTVPVGSLACPECAHALSDMSGNVWEWTRSPYQPYPFDPSDDNNTASGDALWVMRGGAFNDREQNARATTRGGADPGVRRPFIGFRVAITSS
jgi:formylglycine-generating enzyme required for sulfatase activity